MTGVVLTGTLEQSTNGSVYMYMSTLIIMSILTGNGYKINQIDTNHFLSLICLHFQILQIIWHTIVLNILVLYSQKICIHMHVIITTLKQLQKFLLSFF